MDRRLPEEMAPGYELLGPVRRMKDVAKRTPLEVIEKIRALRAEGKTYAAIAKECGVPEWIVSYHLTRKTSVAASNQQAVEGTAQQGKASSPALQPPAATTKAEAPIGTALHPHTCDSNPNAATGPRPLLSIRERGPGERLRGLLVGAGEMVAAIGGQVEVVVSVRRVEG